MRNPFPHELQFGDVYVTPWIPALTLAFFLALITSLLLNRLKLSQWVVAHPYVFLAMMTLYMVLIDTFWIKVF
jgi:hypothetical protein